MEVTKKAIPQNPPSRKSRIFSGLLVSTVTKMKERIKIIGTAEITPANFSPNSFDVSNTNPIIKPPNILFNKISIH